ncbi:MAG: amidohydrolase family protein, partial [Alphaproteobacteria bacterium]|nr:amidohydrolase family protein [Alphaproteobacteria bacterium]
SRPLPEWKGFRGYLSLLDGTPPAVNIACLIGHGTVRQAAMGGDARAPTHAEMGVMKTLVEEGIEAGAIGLSTGLIYDPGRHALTEEIVELAALMRDTGAVYATHMRNEGTGLLDSVAEAIAIGERAGIGVQISHHKASGKEAWGLVAQSLKLIEEAQARGLDVHADQYPYTAGSTVFSAVFREGGLGVNEPGDVVIASASSHREWEGCSVAAIADTMGCGWREAAERILAGEPNATVVIHMMCEDDVRTVMRHPSTMIGSDGLPTLDGKPHPRLYGTFARVLGHYAREENLFPLEEAIYRMTGFPAAKFGFADRGVLKPGAKADLVLFDPKTVVDRGTFEDPKLRPEGISTVWVNGVETVTHGLSTGTRAGRTLRR